VGSGCFWGIIFVPLAGRLSLGFAGGVTVLSGIAERTVMVFVTIVLAGVDGCCRCAGGFGVGKSAFSDVTCGRVSVVFLSTFLVGAVCSS